MNGVRLVARIYFMFGWIALLLGGLAFVVLVGPLTSAFGSNPAQGVATALGIALPLLALALGPFTLWALFAVLLAIHAQNERIAGTLAPSGPPPAVPSRAPLAGRTATFVGEKGYGLRDVPESAARESGSIAPGLIVEVQQVAEGFAQIRTAHGRVGWVADYTLE